MEIIAVKSINPYLQQLNQLLNDGIESGASIGFITPVSEQELNDYWQGVDTSLSTPYHYLWLAKENDQVLGSVQLSLAAKANATHRAEVEKLMVLQSARGKGIGESLMRTLLATAQELALSLLVLDTRLGDVASRLYRKLDFIEAGQIPQFARNNDGQLDATVYFYKQLN